MTAKNTLFLILIITLLVQTVHAFDLGVTSNELEMCACASLNNPIAIRNTGDTNQFFIKQTGSIAENSMLSANLVKIVSGKTSVIESEFSDTCIRPGSYSLTTEVLSASKESKTVTQTIVVKNCPNVAVAVKEAVQSSCACQPAVYELLVKNTGNYTEQYSIGVDSFKDNVKLTASKFVLRPAEEKKIGVQTLLPCSYKENYTISILTKATRSGFLAKTPLQLHIDSCYDFEFTGSTYELDEESGKYALAPAKAQDSYLACKYVTTELPFYVINKGVFDNMYNVTVTGPDFINISASHFSVNKELRKYFKILVSASEGVEEGSYPVTLSVLSDRGDVLKTITSGINISDCFQYEIAFQKSQDKTCCIPSNYEFTIKNKGPFQESFNLSIDGPEWANLWGENVQVDGNSEKTFNMTVTPPCDKLGDYTITIDAALNKEMKSIYESSSLNINTVSEYDCFNPKVVDKQFFADNKIFTHYFENDIPILITHTGLRGTTYTFTIEGPEWLTLNTDTMYLNPGEKGWLTLTAFPEWNVTPGTYDFEIVTSTSDSDVNYSQPLKIDLS